MNWVNILLVILILYLLNLLINFYNLFIVAKLLNKIDKYLKNPTNERTIYDLGAEIDLFYGSNEYSWFIDNQISSAKKFGDNLLLLREDYHAIFDLHTKYRNKFLKMINPINGIPAILETIITIPSRFIARIIPSAYSKIALRYFINFIFWLIGVLIAMFNSDIKNFITKLFFK
ncbi:MAG: hypothetical protein ACRCZN_13455 [Lactococcus lactis]